MLIGRGGVKGRENCEQTFCEKKLTFPNNVKYRGELGSRFSNCSMLRSALRESLNGGLTCLSTAVTIAYNCRHFATKSPLRKRAKEATKVHNCRRLCANCQRVALSPHLRAPHLDFPELCFESAAMSQKIRSRSGLVGDLGGRRTEQANSANLDPRVGPRVAYHEWAHEWDPRVRPHDSAHDSTDEG